MNPSIWYILDQRYSGSLHSEAEHYRTNGKVFISSIWRVLNLGGNFFPKITLAVQKKVFRQPRIASEKGPITVAIKISTIHFNKKND